MNPSLFGWFLEKVQITLKKMYDSLFGAFEKNCFNFL